jgi:hypothetical protein
MSCRFARNTRGGRGCSRRAVGCVSPNRAGSRLSNDGFSCKRKKCELSPPNAVTCSLQPKCVCVQAYCHCLVAPSKGYTAVYPVHNRGRYRIWAHSHIRGPAPSVSSSTSVIYIQIQGGPANPSKPSIDKKADLDRFSVLAVIECRILVTPDGSTFALIAPPWHD